MFIAREYAACVLAALFAGTLVLAGCGIFLALKAGCRIAAKTLVRAHKSATATLERRRTELPVRGAAPATPQPGGMQ
jgi:hypothetical protein